MLFAIEGYYENGEIVLKEQPPVNTKTRVLVTFRPAESESPKPSGVKPGLLEGKIRISDDFNAPLEDHM